MYTLYDLLFKLFHKLFQNSLQSRLLSNDPILFSCVFIVDFDVNLITEELDFGFKAWQNFPESIVGYQAADFTIIHSNATSVFDDNDVTVGSDQEETITYKYVKEMSNEYSMIESSAAWIHRFHFIQFQKQPIELLHFVNSKNDCEDIVMNQIASEYTGMGPIKLTPKYKDFRKIDESLQKGSLYKSDGDMTNKNECLNVAIKLLGRNYLKKQRFRFDPMLYKDRMNIFKKRYQEMDKMKI